MRVKKRRRKLVMKKGKVTRSKLVMIRDKVKSLSMTVEKKEMMVSMKKMMVSIVVMKRNMMEDNTAVGMRVMRDKIVKVMSIAVVKTNKAIFRQKKEMTKVKLEQMTIEAAR